MVTFKDKPLSANFDAIEKISKALSSLRIPIIVIHGGGSFGHYWSTGKFIRIQRQILTIVRVYQLYTNQW